MRNSDLFARTKRDAPAEITDATLRLAFRAGLIRRLESTNDEKGALLYLPLAANVISQMFLALRPELNELRSQQVRGLSEVNVDALASGEIQSYKHLPARAHWENHGATRLTVVSFEQDAETAGSTQSELERIATEFFEYAGLEPQVAKDLGNARVWYSPEPALDLQLFRSNAGAFAATRAAARPFVSATTSEAPLALKEVETPHCDTIDSLAQFLGVPTSRTAKAVFYASGDRVIFAVIRGDLQIDEEKVKRTLGLDALRWATDDEIARVGALQGYASPIGTRGAVILVDDSVIQSPNLVAGANKAGYHLLNTNVPRDYKPNVITDIALARAGDTAPDGVGQLELMRGAALGRIGGPRELNASYLDANGKARKAWAVELELDLGAILLAHVGAHHDDRGILWTRAIAPFDVHIVALNADKPEVAAALVRVNDVIDSTGVESLVDDRNESAGVKFNDADLIGLPLRITIGPKTVGQGGVEFKARSDASGQLVMLDGLADQINRWAEPQE